jgi:hypothetical protein
MILAWPQRRGSKLTSRRREYVDPRFSRFAGVLNVCVVEHMMRAEEQIAWLWTYEER